MASGRYTQMQRETRNDEGIVKAFASKKTLFAARARPHDFRRGLRLRSDAQHRHEPAERRQRERLPPARRRHPDGTYTVAYDSTIGGYKVATVTVTGIDAACADEDRLGDAHRRRQREPRSRSRAPSRPAAAARADPRCALSRAASVTGSQRRDQRLRAGSVPADKSCGRGQLAAVPAPQHLSTEERTDMKLLARVLGIALAVAATFAACGAAASLALGSQAPLCRQRRRHLVRSRVAQRDAQRRQQRQLHPVRRHRHSRSVRRRDAQRHAREAAPARRSAAAAASFRQAAAR